MFKFLCTHTFDTTCKTAQGCTRARKSSLVVFFSTVEENKLCSWFPTVSCATWFFFKENANNAPAQLVAMLDFFFMQLSNKELIWKQKHLKEGVLMANNRINNRK